MVSQGQREKCQLFQSQRLCILSTPATPQDGRGPPKEGHSDSKPGDTPRAASSLKRKRDKGPHMSWGEWSSRRPRPRKSCPCWLPRRTCWGHKCTATSTCTHIRSHSRSHLHPDTPTHTCSHTKAHAFIHLHSHTRAHKSKHTNKYTHFTYTDMHKYIHTHTCIFTCTFIDTNSNTHMFILGSDFHKYSHINCHTYTLMNIQSCTLTHTHPHTHIDICTCISSHAICTPTPCSCKHTHSHLHTLTDTHIQPTHSLTHSQCAQLTLKYMTAVSLVLLKIFRRCGHILSSPALWTPRPWEPSSGRLPSCAP